MAETLPPPDSETDPSAVRLQKWLDNVLALHWSPKDYAKLGLGRHVIGQDDAVQSMAVLLRQHVKRLQAAIKSNTWMSPVPSVKESRPTLLIGSSGCGKTLLASHIARMAGLPYACHDLTNLTAQGWVGMSTNDLVSGLLMRAEGQPGRARWGVLFLDEFDKLRSHDTSGIDVGGQGAQRSLLTLLDGGTIQVEWPPNGPRETRTWQAFSCANLMIILAGAFSGLEDIVATRVHRKRRIGFGLEEETPGEGRDELLRQVTSDDLIAYGLIPEVVGRLNIVVMRDLSREALRDILLKAKDGPLAVQQRMAARERFKLKLTDDLIEALVDEALVQGLGARPLHARLAEVTRRAFYEMPTRVNQFDDGSYVAELGLGGMVDGSYKLVYRGKKRRSNSEEPVGEAVGTKDEVASPQTEAGA